MNRRFLSIIVSLFVAIIIALYPQYYGYYLSIIFSLTIIVVFLEKLTERSYLVVWSVLFSSLFLGGARSEETILQQTLDPIRIVRMGVLISLFLLIYFDITLRKTKNVRAVLKSPLGWFLLYSIIAMLSCLYSKQPFVSLWKGFEVFVNIIVAIYVLQRLKTYEDINKFLTLNVVFLVLLVLSAYFSAIISPSNALREVRGLSTKQLEGIYPPINSNSLTQMAAIIIVVCFIRYFYTKDKKVILLIFLMLPALMLAAGRTSILALCVSLFFFLILNKNYNYLFIIGIILILILGLGGYPYITSFYERGGSLTTMSGRLNTWPVAWDLFKNSPIYGYGFYVAPRIIFAEAVETKSFSTTDNTYLDVLLSIGILGFIPFALMLYSFTKRLIRKLNSSHNKNIKKLRSEIICVAIIIFFRSLTGPSIQILHWNLVLFLALIICTMSLKNYEDSLGTQLSPTSER